MKKEQNLWGKMDSVFKGVFLLPFLFFYFVALIGSAIQMILISAIQGMISIPICLFFMLVNFLDSKNINENLNYSHITEFLSLNSLDAIEIKTIIAFWVISFMFILASKFYEKTKNIFGWF